MRHFLFLAAPLLALSLHAAAQTTTKTKTTTSTPVKTPAPATKTPAPTPSTTGQQVTEVTEDLDPATGKVIRRTTRTYSGPTGTAAPASTTTSPATAEASVPAAPASDAVVSDFFREKTAVSKLTKNELLSAYSRFIEKVRDERRGWQANDWATAANVLSSLNARYDQLRATFTLDDKITIRSQQAEFQTLRTARQVSDQVSNKL